MRLSLALSLLALGCGARTGLTCELGECVDRTDPSGSDGGEDGTLIADGDPGDDSSSSSDDDGIHLDAPPIDSAPVVDLGVDTIDVTCPALLPHAGSACAGSLACNYAGCDPTKEDLASCISGKWHLVAAACASETDRCPPARPVRGTPCPFPDGTFCVYNVSCAGGDWAFCRAGKWDGKYGSCSSSATCPATRPVLGTPCSAPSASCTYLNACGVPSYVSCGGGVWTGTEAPSCETDPSCPAIEPAYGAPCTPPKEFKACAWKNACGGVDYGACGWLTGKPTSWTIIRPACPATGCPTTPTEGSACSGTSTCTYPTGGDCSLVCTCSSDKWSCKQPPCMG
ncbi:MAG: hypothetical protein ACXVEF_20775 [Polyangiales bacterium]